MSRPLFNGARPGALIVGSDYKALAAIRSLARHGIPCAVVDNQPRSAWYSRYLRSRHRWRGPLVGPDFTAFLGRLADTEGFTGWLLFPMQDDAVRTVAESQAELGVTYRIVTPPWSVLRRVHDKRCLNDIADVAGVAHPATWYPADEAELAGMAITFPAIVKPTMSIGLQHRLGLKALPAHDRAALLRSYRLAAEVIPAEEVMVQELIPTDGRQQYSVAAFCCEGTVAAAMTARRSRQYPPDFGLSSTFVEAMDVPGLIEIASLLLRAAGLSGMLEVEFVLDPRDAVFKLLDVNVRPWSWHGLCSACGIDFAVMQYRWALGQPLEESFPHYGPKWMRFVTDVPAVISEMRAGTVTVRDYARSFRRPRVGSVLDLRDPLPVLGDLSWLVRRTRHRPSATPIGTVTAR